MSEGALKKKNKSKLTMDIISDSFLKRVPSSGIVAYVMYPD